MMNKNQAIDPNNFDPIIEKILGANAYELEKLHHEIRDSQNGVIKGLAKVLVPDKFLLPEPGYTVAQINPKYSRIHITPEDEFQISGKSETGEDYLFNFTSLFEHKYPKCQLTSLLTSQVIWEIKQSVPTPKSTSGNTLPSEGSTRSIWLGLDLEKVNPDEKITFFVGNKIIDEFDKDYAVFHRSKWFINGEDSLELKVSSGLKLFDRETRDNQELIDALDIFDSYEKQITHRFANSFLTISGFPDDLSSYKRIHPPKFEDRSDSKKPLVWILAEFELGIPFQFFSSTVLYPNAIPLVNRKLQNGMVAKKSYNRILLPFPTDDYFLGVNRIWDDSSENGAYQLVDYLTRDTQPSSYLVRRGDRVRRLHAGDASSKIHELLDLIHEEVGTFKESGENKLNQEFEIIDNALNRIKLRMRQIDVHGLNNMSYYALAKMPQSSNLVLYEYWECQGSKVAVFGDQTALNIKASNVNIENSFTIIPIQSGKSEKSEDDYLNYLKSAIISRNKIVTRGDIEIYCQTHYGHLISSIEITHKVMALNDRPSKLERVIFIIAELKNSLLPDEQEFLKAQIQNELNAMTSFFTPIVIKLKDINV